MERWTSEPTEETRMDSPQFTSRDLILIKCKETIEALTMDLENERKLRMVAEGDLDSLHQDLATLEDQVEELKGRELTVAESARGLQLEKEEEENRAQRLYQENERLKKDKVEAENKVQVQQRTIQSLNEALDRVNRELDVRQHASSEWRRTLPALEQRLESLGRENQQLQEERSHYFQLYERETEQKKSLQRLLEEAKTDSESLQRKLKSQAEDHQQQLSTMEKQRQAQYQELSDSYNRKATAYHDQVQQGLKEQKALINRATEEVERLQGENEDLNQQLVETMEVCENRQREVEEVARGKDSVEKELNSVLKDLEALQKSQKLESDLKDKMHASALVRLDEETQRGNKLEATVDDLAEELARQEDYYQSQLAETRQALEKSQEDYQRLANELQNTREALKKAQQSASDLVQEEKTGHKEEVERLQIELQRKEQSLSALVARVQEVETQRESDHDYFQIELLRAKEQRNQALIAKEEEIRRLQSERDRVRKPVERYPPPIPQAVSPTPSVPSLRFGPKAGAQRPLRNSSSQSLRQSLESPHSSLSHTSQDWTFTSPRTAKSRAQSDGLRLLSQLKDLTARMEGKPPSSKYA